jgi:hypothetical protein
MLPNKQFAGVALAAALAFGLNNGASAAHLSYAAPVSVSYWNGTFNFPDTFNFVAYTDTNSSAGITFNQGPDFTDTISAIPELADLGGTNSDPSWPGAFSVFAADFTTTMFAPTSGKYTIKFGTDDAGYLYVDGNLVAAQPGAHGISPQTYTVSLGSGLHSVEVQYDNSFCCGSIVQFASVPEPSSWGLMIVGVASVGAMMRNSRRKEETFA